MYTGDLVQGRTKKISYKSKKMASVPQRDWIIVPDSHEPVISRRTFERVQEMLHARTRSTGPVSYTHLDVYKRQTLNSVVLALLTVLFTVTTASMAAYIIARREFPGKKLLTTSYLLSMFISVGSVALYPLYGLLHAVGPVSYTHLDPQRRGKRRSAGIH